MLMARIMYQNTEAGNPLNSNNFSWLREGWTANWEYPPAGHRSPMQKTLGRDI